MIINFRKYRNMLVPESDEDYSLIQSLTEDVIYSVDLKKANMRTVKQNRALHLWCKMIADELNKNNLFITSFTGAKLEYTMITVKEHIIKIVIKQMFGLNSTTKLTKKQVDELIDYLTIIMNKWNIELPMFPNKEYWND